MGITGRAVLKQKTLTTWTLLQVLVSPGGLVHHF